MFKKSVLLVICFVFVFSMAFMYADDAEIARLRAQGQREGWTFTVGKTSVSDIPLDQLCGFKIPKNWRNMGKFEDDYFSRQTRATPPATYDWRDYGKVTGVRNQGSCGSCWAFGMLGSYEAILAINGEGLNNLSEQFLVRCNTHGYGCNGGWWCYDDMYDGIPLESCYPYTATDGSCNHSCTLYYPVDDWYLVGSSSGVPTTSAIKQAIYDYGPLSVAVYVNSAFQNYTGGIFNSCSNYSPNHAVVLVGWGSDHWIMKNSWGTSWGESGYMRIAFGCSNIGYAASYALPEDTIPDTTPPVISNIDAGDITSSSATITWTTDEPATSVVYYGTTTGYGQTESVSGYTTSHSVELTGLSDDTLYHFKVESTDASSNTAQSGDNNFTTLEQGTTPEIYVYDISMQKFSWWIIYRAEGTITIRDTNGAVVPSATVYIQWSGKASGTDNDTTNSSGQVTFNSGWYWGNGTFTITVTNVTHATMQYNSSLNNETSDSI